MLTKTGNVITQPIFRMVDQKNVELMEDYDFYYDGQLITIKSGFIFDGATMFRSLWSILGICPFGWVLPAALKHDYIYIFEGKIPNGPTISRKWADKQFVDDLLELRLINIYFVWLYKITLKFAGLYFWREYYK